MADLKRAKLSLALSRGHMMSDGGIAMSPCSSSRVLVSQASFCQRGLAGLNDRLYEKHEIRLIKHNSGVTKP